MNQKSLRWVSVFLAAALLLSIGSPTVFAMQEAAPVNTAEASTVSMSSAVTDTQPEATAAVDSNIEINSTTFPDEHFRNWVQDHIAGAGDGVLTPEECAAVTEINVSYLNIEDLTGIEYFPNLKKLLCYNTLLKSLDVSANTALEYLYCESNQLMRLDVSNNTALKYLYCDYNQLTSLDVSGATALEYLDCYRNQLTSLDVSGATALKKLRCFNNQLTSLDVSNNTALEYLSCFNNQLTGLDVSNNTALKELYCYDNQFTSLDVSSNTALEELYCYDNQLTSLDVSSNTALRDLSCCNNQLTSLDVSNNTALEYLYCSDNQLTGLDLNGNPSLKALECSSNPFAYVNLPNLPNGQWTRTTMDSLQTVKLNSLETSLDLRESFPGIQVDRISNFQGAMLNNGILTDWTVGSPITYDYDCGQGKSINITLQFWDQNSWITPLTISDSVYGEPVQPQAASAFGEVQYLYSDARDGTYQEEVPVNAGTYWVKAIVEETESYTGLETELVSFQILPKSCDQLTIPNIDGYTNLDTLVILDGDKQLVQGQDYDLAMQSIGFNATTTITFKGNYTGIVTQEYLLSSVEVNEVNFPDEHFRNWIMDHVAGADDGVLTLEECAAVTEIDVSHLSVEDLTGIEYFSNLKHLSCNHNYLKSLDVSHNTALEELDCNYNDLTGLDLSGNPALTHLDCNSNKLTSLDASGATALEYLYCDYNQLTSLDLSGATALEYLYCNYNQLTSLDVSGATALEYLYCYENQLTSLDVSGDTALKKLDCNRNQLTSLDVSSDTALDDLRCRYNNLTSLDVSNNTALEYLDCYKNQLTSLDLGGDTALEYLLCWDNQLTSLDLSGDTALKKLYCYYNKLTSLDLSGNPSLEYLDCSVNPLAYVNLPDGQSKQIVMGNLQTVKLNSLETSLDLRESFPGIQVDRISNLKGATLQGETLIDWSYNTPITYNYDCGQGVTLPVVLEISPASSISIVSAASSTDFSETEQPKAETCAEQTTEVTADSVSEQAAQLAEESVPAQSVSLDDEHSGQTVETENAMDLNETPLDLSTY